MGRKNSTGNVYEKITGRVLGMLDEGVAPWRKPWVTAAPQSIRSRSYRGINALLLGLASHGDPRWLTYREAERRGGHVRKGESGTVVVFWRWIKDARDGGDDEDAPGRPIARSFHLFNVEQCEGLTLDPCLQATVDVESVAAADAVIEGYDGGPAVEYGAAF